MVKIIAPSRLDSVMFDSNDECKIKMDSGAALMRRVYRRALLDTSTTRAVQLPDEIPSVPASCRGLDRTARSRTRGILRVVKVSSLYTVHARTPEKKCLPETFIVFFSLATWQQRDIKIHTDTLTVRNCL